MKLKLKAALRAVLTVAVHDKVVVNAERTIAAAVAVAALRALGFIH